MSTATAPATCNIAAALVDMARRQPNALCIVDPHDLDVTYEALDGDSDTIARGLTRIGLTRGARIAVMITPGVDFFAVMFALFKAGMVPVMIDPGIGLTSLKTCLAEAAPEAFIGITKAHAARVVLGWARGSIRKVITVGTRLFWGGQTLDQIRALGAGGGPVLADTKEDEIAAILFTSGSTGIPKGAIYRHGNFMGQVEMIRDAFGIQPGEIDLPTFAPFALFDPALGMTTVLPDMDFSKPGSVDPKHLVALMEKHGVTNMFGSPAVLNRIAENGQPLPKTIRRVLSAGAPMRPVVLDGMKKLLPEGVQVFTPYGATESLPVAITGSDEILNETRHATENGKGICVGKPTAGVTVDIIEITDEPIEAWAQTKLLPVGQIGEIVVRSRTVTTGYFAREAQTKAAKIRGPNGESAHRMGDVGYFDAKGRLWYCGRKSHRVVTKDGTLFTEQVEGVFSAHVGGKRTALVGVSGKPVICVEGEKPSTKPGHPLAATIEHVLSHPGPFPVDIRHNSKIFREKLAVWAAKELA